MASWSNNEPFGLSIAFRYLTTTGEFGEGAMLTADDVLGDNVGEGTHQ